MPTMFSKVHHCDQSTNQKGRTINRPHRCYRVVVFTQKMTTNYSRVLVGNTTNLLTRQIHNEHWKINQIPECILEILPKTTDIVQKQEHACAKRNKFFFCLASLLTWSLNMYHFFSPE